MNADGTGYVQENFHYTCNCRFEITKDTLGAAKFVRDLMQHDVPHMSWVDETLRIS